jgi:hypothetical protein
MRRLTAALTLTLLLVATGVRAQDSRPWGRVSFFANSSQLTADTGDSRTYSEFVTSAAYHSAELTGDGLEFGLDARLANYAGGSRDPRVSVYDGWVGARLLDGALGVRGGHMWLTELGGLGAVAGGMAEYRRPLGDGRLRIAGFGGVEPDTYKAAYVPGVRRMGGYAAWDGSGLRRHVVGYVLIKNGSMTERSVLTTTNFVPVGTAALVYQAAEFDLQGPGGQGHGGLTYFFVNGHAAATRRVDVQATFHRGRSIDARTITQDQLAGRAVLPRALEGLLFESASVRMTVEVLKGTRVFGGYGQDRTNRGDPTTGRITAGGSASSVMGSGVDVTVSYSRIDRQTRGSYASWYLSAGRSIATRVYVTGDYSSSVSVLRLTGTDGVTIENRPTTKRVSGSAIVNLSRLLSLLVTGEHTIETGASENRVLAGLTCRLR